MPRTIRLWQRDTDIMTEAGRSPLLTGQIARLHDFPSRKKAAERLCPLYRAGLLKRVAYFTPAMQGKPEFVYYTGTRPHPRALPHTIAVSEVRVQLTDWLRHNPSYAADVFYAGEIAMSSTLLPDLTMLVRKGEHAALVFVEIDLGTEPVTSTTGYSLAGKLGSYAAYFDAGTYTHDFAWAGQLRGFRVALAVPPGRLHQVEHVVRTENHDFVLLTTTEQARTKFFRAVFSNHENARVDVLGRPGDLPKESLGDLVEQPIPTTTTANNRCNNDLAPTLRDPF
ncbi:MAG TPA: replication-relaxation family protein [Paludibaculum sp.]|jgi:hypothetical protein